MSEAQARVAPAAELVNTFEFEEMAKRSLSAAAFAELAGSDRRAFERITFRPRMMVNTIGLDLTVELFGHRMFAPILVAPAAEQKRFHPEGELATVRGATAAKTTVVLSSRSNCPIAELAAQPGSMLWAQVHAGPDVDAARRQVDQAVAAGSQVLCITAGGADWSVIDRLRQGIRIPVVLKGVMSPEEAAAAIARGIDGIVVSTYTGRAPAGLASPLEVLPAIARAVAGKVPILIDGSFRRGTDILKALALGARAVMLGRPVLWALAAYGAEGVRTILEMQQTELARAMVMCGKPNLHALDASVVKIHAAGPSR